MHRTRFFKFQAPPPRRPQPGSNPEPGSEPNPGTDPGSNPYDDPNSYEEEPTNPTGTPTNPDPNNVEDPDSRPDASSTDDGNILEDVFDAGGTSGQYGIFAGPAPSFPNSTCLESCQLYSRYRDTQCELLNRAYETKMATVGCNTVCSTPSSSGECSMYAGSCSLR